MGTAWGSMYTAHGDFVNAWHAQSMQYIVDSCMNKASTPDATCAKNIPTYYSAASADVRLTSSGSTEAAGATLTLAPGDVIFIKFPAPAHLDDYAYTGSYLQTFAGNVSNTSRHAQSVRRIHRLGRRDETASRRLHDAEDRRYLSR
jgi:hypothetical protein